MLMYNYMGLKDLVYMGLKDPFLDKGACMFTLFEFLSQQMFC